MKAFTYVGLTLIMLTTIVLSIKTFYYNNDVNPMLFIVTGFVIFIFCLIKAIEEIKNDSNTDN